MTSEWTIRNAKPPDAEALSTIARAAYAPFVADIGREPPPMLQDFPADIAAGRVLVAARNAGLGGYVVCHRHEEPGDWLIENLAVEPAARGTGLGRFLIEAAEARGREAGCVRAVLYTNAAMTENLTLYPYLGYVEIVRTRQDGLDRVFFAKPLDAER